MLTIVSIRDLWVNKVSMDPIRFDPIRFWIRFMEVVRVQGIKGGGLVEGDSIVGAAYFRQYKKAAKNAV